jgi:hypothetical protein
MSTIPTNERTNHARESFMQRSWDEYVRKDIELYKQTDRYKEYEKRKRAEMESEKPKEE